MPGIWWLKSLQWIQKTNLPTCWLSKGSQDTTFNTAKQVNLGRVNNASGIEQKEFLVEPLASSTKIEANGKRLLHNPYVMLIVISLSMRYVVLAALGPLPVKAKRNKGKGKPHRPSKIKCGSPRKGLYWSPKIIFAFRLPKSTSGKMPRNTSIHMHNIA